MYSFLLARCSTGAREIAGKVFTGVLQTFTDAYLAPAKMQIVVVVLGFGHGWVQFSAQLDRAISSPNRNRTLKRTRKTSSSSILSLSLSTLIEVGYQNSQRNTKEHNLHWISWLNYRLKSLYDPHSVYNLATQTLLPRIRTSQLVHHFFDKARDPQY